MITTKNPVLKDDTFSSQLGPVHGGSGLPGDQRADTMSIRGVITKGAILGLLMAFTFGFSWDAVMQSDGTSGGAWTFLGGIGGFILSLVISFKPHLAPWLAPPYALLQGLMLGAISAWYESGFGGSYTVSGYEGIVFQAALGTMGVFTAMLLLYRTRVIKVTERFRSIVMVSMLAIVLVYLASFVLSLFGASIPLIHGAGPIGIGFSVLVIGIASLMLLVDFDQIERGVALGSPKYMEWYSAFSLLVTIVWIYLEMLRLLAKLRR